MATKRSFSADNIPMKSADYHGTCYFVRASRAPQSISVELTFEEAVKLSLAVQSCVMNLNRCDRRSTAGREMGMLLSLQDKFNTLVVAEKPVSSE